MQLGDLLVLLVRARAWLVHQAHDEVVMVGLVCRQLLNVDPSKH
jgi:hypothetical protein